MSNIVERANDAIRRDLAQSTSPEDYEDRVRGMAAVLTGMAVLAAPIIIVAAIGFVWLLHFVLKSAGLL